MGTVVRLVVLFGVIIGIAYGLTRAIRSGRQQRALQRGRQAHADIMALRARRAAGELTEREYESSVREIYEFCAREGVDIPELEAGQV